MNSKLRILIVDDDRRMTRTLADILTISGYEAVEALSGAEAIEKVRTLAFDCVLSDVKMPVMNGVELHKQLRLAQPGLPVVLMTAYAADDLIRQGLDEGVVGVFDKPLDINQILSFFTSLVRQRTVVIVDNDPIFCRTLDDILSRRGFMVTQITDPHIDVEQMTANAQIILLDMKLNHITGLDVLADIRKRYPKLPVVMVTGYQQEMADVIAAAVGIDAFACLYKPLEIPELLKILGQVQLKRLRGLLKAN
jgi:two-component system response regulator HydG